MRTRSGAAAQCIKTNMGNKGMGKHQRTHGQYHWQGEQKMHDGEVQAWRTERMEGDEREKPVETS
jgi:hypothetical protein